MLLPQTIFDKRKLSIIGFSMECFTADFSKFSRTTFKICFFGCLLSISHQLQVFQEFFWNFLISSDSKTFFFFCGHFARPTSKIQWVCSSATVSFTFGDNNLVPFHLWWKGFVLKCEKVYKYLFQDCRPVIYKNLTLYRDIFW